MATEERGNCVDASAAMGNSGSCLVCSADPTGMKNNNLGPIDSLLNYVCKDVNNEDAGCLLYGKSAISKVIMTKVHTNLLPVAMVVMLECKPYFLLQLVAMGCSF
jgi:hypothetical protein